MADAETTAATSALWARLLALDLDGAAALSFSRRLARDNGWPPAFARRVVLEYKKFVFLAATCGHPVTPSDEVDQAWHLHLVYTRSYWDELCGEVLGFPLHHGPTRGGAAEGQKFQDWYARTKQAYHAAFGSAPPADIWPPVSVRFGEAPHFRRVNLRRHVLLPRLRWRPRLDRWQVLALLAGLALVGCTARLPLNPLNWYGREFLLLFWTLMLTLLPLALLLRYFGRGSADDYVGPPLSPYGAARLADEGRRIADSALAAMAHAGHIELPLPGMVVPTDQPPPTDPYEYSIWHSLSPDGTTVTLARQAGLSGANFALSALDEELEQAGLLLPAARRRLLNWLPLGVALALGLLGGLKVLVGLSRHRPVEYLVMSLVALVGGVVLMSHGRAWATGRGARLLAGLSEALRGRRPRAGDHLAPQLVALNVALLGLGALNALGMNSVAARLTAADQSGSGGSDGGSGCSSGDGGGSGCGGCGGCGGGGD